MRPRLSARGIFCVRRELTLQHDASMGPSVLLADIPMISRMRSRCDTLQWGREFLLAEMHV